MHILHRLDMYKNKILKKAVSFILILFITLVTNISIAATGIVSSDTVRVRKEPNTSSSIVGLVSIGDKVEIIEKTGSWYKVKCDFEGTTKTGYIRSDLLNVKNAENINDSTSNTENNTDTDTDNEKNINNNIDNNNNQKNNNTDNNTQNNDNVGNNTQNNGNEQNLQTSSNQNQISNTALSTLKIGQEELLVGQEIIISNEVYLKILPSVNSTNIEKVDANVQVKITDIINKWCKIEVGEKTGWLRIEQ